MRNCSVARGHKMESSGWWSIKSDGKSNAEVATGEPGRLVPWYANLVVKQ